MRRSRGKTWDRNAVEKGVFRAHTYIQVTHDIHPRPPRQALSLSLLRLSLSGRWCGKSVVLTGTRWSTTLKAVVAVKEEGCRLEGKRWVDRVHGEEEVVWSYGTTMYLICRPLYGLGYSWWSGDGVLVGAWCTATKGGGVVVWGGGEILIKTYPGTNPCRLSPSPPRFIQPHGTPSSLYTSLASSLDWAERSQWLSRGNIFRPIFCSLQIMLSVCTILYSPRNNFPNKRNYYNFVK